MQSPIINQKAGSTGRNILNDPSFISDRQINPGNMDLPDKKTKTDKTDQTAPSGFIDLTYGGKKATSPNKQNIHNENIVKIGDQAIDLNKLEGMELIYVMMALVINSMSRIIKVNADTDQLLNATKSKEIDLKKDKEIKRYNDNIKKQMEAMQHGSCMNVVLDCVIMVVTGALTIGSGGGFAAIGGLLTTGFLAGKLGCDGKAYHEILNGNVKDYNKYKSYASSINLAATIFGFAVVGASCFSTVIKKALPMMFKKAILLEAEAGIAGAEDSVSKLVLNARKNLEWIEASKKFKVAELGVSALTTGEAQIEEAIYELDMADPNKRNAEELADIKLLSEFIEMLTRILSQNEGQEEDENHTVSNIMEHAFNNLNELGNAQVPMA